jgi:hypothetical protein
LVLVAMVGRLLILAGRAVVVAGVAVQLFILLHPLFPARLL